jgi:hypothetical protein
MLAQKGRVPRSCACQLMSPTIPTSRCSLSQQPHTEPDNPTTPNRTTRPQLLATGHHDGRMVLLDMQTGDVLYSPISDIKHAGPVRAVHVCEGHKKTLAICGSEDRRGRVAVYVWVHPSVRVSIYATPHQPLNPARQPLRLTIAANVIL